MANMEPWVVPTAMIAVRLLWAFKKKSGLGILGYVCERTYGHRSSAYVHPSVFNTHSMLELHHYSEVTKMMVGANITNTVSAYSWFLTCMGRRMDGIPR